MNPETSGPQVITPPPVQPPQSAAVETAPTGQLPPFGQYLKHCWQVYKSRFWTLLGAIALSTIIPYLIIFVFFVTGIFGFIFVRLGANLLLGHPGVAEAAVGASLVFQITMLVVLVLVVLFAVWLAIRLSMVPFYVALDAESKAGIIESFRRGKGKFWRVILFGIVFALVVMGGIISGLIPGIFLSVAFVPAFVALLNEQQSAFGALSRARDLTKGHWWQTLLRAVVVPVALSILAIVPAAFLNIAGFILFWALEAFFTVLVVVYYQDLARLRPSSEPPTRGRKLRYLGLALLPLALLAVLLFTGVGSKIKDRLVGYVMQRQEQERSFEDFANRVLADMDRDGLTDEEEARYGTDPNNSDTDGDGLADGDEVKVYSSNPLLADTDGDGFNDGEEAARGYSPVEASSEPATLEERQRWEERIQQYGLHEPTISTLGRGR